MKHFLKVHTVFIYIRLDILFLFYVTESEEERKNISPIY